MDSLASTPIGKFGINLAVSNYDKFKDTLVKSGGLWKTFSKEGTEAWKSFGKEVLNSAKTMGASMVLFPKFESAIKTTANALSLAGLSMKALAVSSTVMYSRTAVLTTVLTTVGRNAGYAAGKILETRKAVVGLGITTQDASQAIIKLAQNEVKLADATGLARTAQDLAVISGENSSEAYSTLIDSIGSLSPMLLRQYGLTKTLTDIEEMYARKINKSANALTEVEIKQAMVNYIMVEGKKAAGNYASSMEDAGKKVASFSRLLQEIYNDIGKQGMVIYTPIITMIYDVLTAINKLPESVKLVAGVFLTTGGVILTAVAPLTAFIFGVVGLGRTILAITGFFQAWWPAIQETATWLWEQARASAVLSPLIDRITAAVVGNIGAQAGAANAAGQNTIQQVLLGQAFSLTASLITVETAALGTNGLTMESNIAKTMVLTTEKAKLNAVITGGLTTVWGSFTRYMTGLGTSISVVVNMVGVALKSFALLNPIVLAMAAAVGVLAYAWWKENEANKARDKRLELLIAERDKRNAVNEIEKKYLGTVMSLTKAQDEGNTVMEERLMLLRKEGITVDALDNDYKTLLARQAELAEKLDIVSQVKAAAAKMDKEEIEMDIMSNTVKSKELQRMSEETNLMNAIKTIGEKLNVVDIEGFKNTVKRTIAEKIRMDVMAKGALVLRDASRAEEQAMIRLRETADAASAAVELGTMSWDEQVAAYGRVEKASRKLYNANVMETNKYISDVIALDNIKKKSIFEHIAYSQARFDAQKALGTKSLKDELELQKKHHVFMLAEQRKYMTESVGRKEFIADALVKSQKNMDDAIKKSADATTNEEKIASQEVLRIAIEEYNRLLLIQEKFTQGRLLQNKEIEASEEKTQILNKELVLQGLGIKRQALEQLRSLNLVTVNEYAARIKKIAELEAEQDPNDPVKKLERQMEEERNLRTKRDTDIERNTAAMDRYIEASDKGVKNKMLMNQAEYTKGQTTNINAYFEHYKDVIEAEYEITDGARRRELQQDIAYGAEREEINKKLAGTYTITNLGTMAKNDANYKAYSMARINLDKKMYDYEFERGKEQLRNDNARITEQSNNLKKQLATITGNDAAKLRQYSSIMDKIKAKDTEIGKNKMALLEMEENKEKKMREDRLSFQDKMDKFIFEKTHTAAEVAKKELVDEVMKYVKLSGGKLKDTRDYVNLQLQELNKSAGELNKSIDKASDGMEKLQGGGSSDKNSWAKSISDFATTDSFGSVGRFGTPAAEMGSMLGDVGTGGVFGSMQRSGWGAEAVQGNAAGFPGMGKPKADTFESLMADQITTAEKQLSILDKIERNTSKAIPEKESGKKVIPNELSGNASFYAEQFRARNVQVGADKTN